MHQRSTGRSNTLRRISLLVASFALAVTGWFLLGELEGLTAAETLCKLRRGGAPTPRELDARVPVGLDRICAKAAAPEPDDRYETARALRDEIDGYLERV